MRSAIRDNKKRGTVGEFLRDCVKTDAKLSIVSAYFTIYAYDRLRDELDGIDHLRFLFGEPSFLKRLDPTKDNQRNFVIEPTTGDIKLGKRLAQNAVALACYNWFKDKAEIKSMVKPNFLHGKLYHIQQANGIERAIAGSSNFTVNGLGLGNAPNIELNMIVDNDRDREDLKDWFDDVWNDDTGLVEDVKEQVLDYLQQLFVENDPEFVYFKTLFHLFNRFLNEQNTSGLLDGQTGFKDSQVWGKLYSFQQDGVVGVINKIERHGGCILADSVGLGKTFEALAVIKYYELKNKDVLVLCPKKLEQNWTAYQGRQPEAINPLKKDRLGFSVLFHTDLGRTKGRTQADNFDLSTFDWSVYDLVVIDESHNFRNNTAGKYDDEGNLVKSRYRRLMDDIINAGARTKVLLLSATPVNNTLRDLRNQIYLITGNSDTALSESTGISNIKNTIATAQKQFADWADPKKDPSGSAERTIVTLLEKLDSSFFKLLDELTIARSRRHIEKFYDMSAIGKFPERLKPLSIYAELDQDELFPAYDEVNQAILGYELSLFNPSKYVHETYKDQYGERRDDKTTANFSQEKREHFLIGMMKVGFLKRLESSIQSFEISMLRTINKIKDLEHRIKDFQAGLESGFLSLEELAVIDEDDDESAAFNEAYFVGKKRPYNLAHLDVDQWLIDLKKDRSKLTSLYNNALAITPERDAKLNQLKSLIIQKVRSPINAGNKKVIVFTAFADTANYLYVNLHEWAKTELGIESALVSGGTGSNRSTFNPKGYTYQTEFNTILTNFSPLSKQRAALPQLPQTGEIDLLIATDCISEGQNLQDCDYLVNYDIHWNPVRIIQRFGRIDRLGSRNAQIQLVNFWPTKDLDQYINLKTRVEARMALVDITATGEDNLLKNDQIEDLVTEDLKYRDQQLKRLQTEVLDLEDLNDGGVSLTDFTLDDFRIDLLNFIENNRQRLEEAPLGLHAVVPAPGGAHYSMLNGRTFSSDERDILKPGVVFCLRQLGETTSNEKVNPLQPFFMVYIREDGNVRFNYTNAKQILEIYRLLCQGRQQPYEQLCRLFNTQTGNGEDMALYSDLLQKAIGSISRHYQKKIAVAAKNIGRSGNKFMIPEETEQLLEAAEADEGNPYFEIITWLVIK
jgi:SNF2 family DNA or RNA helicase